jgi:hypothetical protein
MAKYLIVWIVKKLILKIENSFELVIQFQTIFIFKVLSDSKICKKNINLCSFNWKSQNS